MAGHSKWHNIQYRKGTQDAKRGKIFTKLIKEITVIAKAGGSVMENNSALRTVVDKALAANMKKDTIESAIKRGCGTLDDSNYQQVRYEGYGLAGTAIMVNCLTDNRKRSVADVRYAFAKYNGNLGTDGSVAYLFTQKGYINFKSANEDRIMELALELGAEDVINNSDGSIDVITTYKDFFTIKDAFIAAGLNISYSQITFEATTLVELNLVDAQKFIKLIDCLENLNDTQQVYHNAFISNEIMQQL